MRFLLNCFLCIFLFYCKNAFSVAQNLDSKKENLAQSDKIDLGFDPMKPILSSIQIDSNIVLPKDFYIGDPGAKIVVVDYSSFTCGHCYKIYKEILSKLYNNYIKRGDVVLVMRDFPLDAKSMQASWLLKCYESKLDKFVDHGHLLKVLDGLFKDLSYRSDKDEFEESLYKFGKQNMNLDYDEIKDCMHNEQIKKYILCSKFFGLKNLGINGTPAIYVNGKLYKGPASFESFEEFMLESAGSNNF